PGWLQLTAIKLGRYNQPLDDRLDSSGSLPIGGNESNRRLESVQDRGPIADHVKIVNGQGHTDFPGDRQQMQDGIRRSSGPGDTGNRIFEGLSGQDVARFQAATELIHHGLPGFEGYLLFSG